MQDDLLRPDWAAAASVGALMTTRMGGVSQAPWLSMNLGASVGDDAVAVASNRERLVSLTGSAPVWLHQAHGSGVVHIGSAMQSGRVPVADAAWTVQPGLVLGVLVADCLPVLLASRDGRVVGAAHAGWRGLAAGVLENTVQAMCQGAGVAPQDLVAWLGACIGPRAFEVGADVLEAFGACATAANPAHFEPRRRADGSPCWLANLPQLARGRLHDAGVGEVTGGGWCTYSDDSRFFSFRRDGVTGRHVAAIWRLSPI